MKRNCLAILLSLGLPAGGALAAPPYPPSKSFSGITWEESTLTRKAKGSDNWAVTWGSDDHIYTTWGDGGGFGGADAGMGAARIEGPPESFTGTNLWSVARGYRGGKSEGILSVGGVLYMMAGPGSDYQPWRETWLMWSNDLGKSWQYSEIFFRLADGFSKPTFLNFGRDYAGARDDYVYIYGLDASAGTSVKPTKLNLARVRKRSITQRDSYEFFMGFDSGRDPLWTSDVSQRKPVFVDATGGIADSPSVIYNPVIKRYLMSKTHDSDRSVPHGGLGVFDAPEPWGPWTTIEYIERWRGSTTIYFATFPTKWIGPDGLTMWMIFTGYGSVTQDAYQHIRVKLVPIAKGGGDSVPPDAPRNVKGR